MNGGIPLLLQTSNYSAVQQEDHYSQPIMHSHKRRAPNQRPLVRCRQRCDRTRAMALVRMEYLQLVRQACRRADGSLGAGHVDAPDAVGAPLPGVGEAVP